MPARHWAVAGAGTFQGPGTGCQAAPLDGAVTALAAASAGGACGAALGCVLTRGARAWAAEGWHAEAAAGAGAGAGAACADGAGTGVGVSRLATVAGPLRLELCTAQPWSGLAGLPACAGLGALPASGGLADLPVCAGLQGLRESGWGGGEVDREAGAVLRGDWERAVRLWGLEV